MVYKMDTPADPAHARAVAEEMRRQIGPMGLMAIGAHAFIACTRDDMPALQMSIRTGRRAAHFLTVRLLPSDTYEVFVERHNARTLRREEIASESGVYCDDLQDCAYRLFTAVAVA